MITTATPFPPSQISDGIQSQNLWILKMIGPYIKGRILEINSGTNSLCPLFLEYNRPIHLCDANHLNRQALRETYIDNSLVRAVHDFDFITSDFRESHPDILDVFDTVIGLNLLMTDFGKMVDNIRYVLPQGGTLALILPAYTSIYHGLDQNFDDWKRYNGKTLRQILIFNFSILKVKYLNLTPVTAKDIFGHSGLSALLIVKKD